MKICGIYTITNSLNNKIYVGYSQDIMSRFRDHIKNLKANKHSNNHLQRAWNEQSGNNFVLEVLEECGNNLLCALEHYWCNTLNTHNDEFGYNQKLTNPNDRRVKVSKEQKKKISETLTGRKLPKEQVEKTRKSIVKIIESRGYWMTDEGKASISKSRKGINNRPGYRHSQDTKDKISKNNSGKVHTEETKEHLRKIGIGTANAKGKRSPESIEKIRLGALKGWENRKNKQK